MTNEGRYDFGWPGFTSKESHRKGVKTVIIDLRIRRHTRSAVVQAIPGKRILMAYTVQLVGGRKKNRKSFTFLSEQMAFVTAKRWIWWASAPPTIPIDIETIKHPIMPTAIAEPAEEEEEAMIGDGK